MRHPLIAGIRRRCPACKYPTCRVVQKDGIEPSGECKFALLQVSACGSSSEPPGGENCLLIVRRNRNRRRAACGASFRTLLKPICAYPHIRICPAKHWQGGQDLHLRCEPYNTHPTQPPRAAGLSRLSVGVSLPSRDRLSVCQRRFVPQPIVIIVNRAFPPSIRRDRRSCFFGDKSPWRCRRLPPWRCRRL